MNERQRLKSKLTVLEKDKAQIEEEIRIIKDKLSITPLWVENDGKINSDHDHIGFYNLTKLKVILRSLYEGKKLLLSHNAFGKYYVQMNPQKNCIIVYKTSDKGRGNVSEQCAAPNEDNILQFMLYFSGEWYIINDSDT